MARNQQNTIHDALIEFSFQTLGNEGFNGNDFVTWAKTNILEILDQQATDLTKSGMVVELEELKLDLNISVENNLFAESDRSKGTISQQIEAAIKEAIAKNGVSQISHTQLKANAILGYLKQGWLIDYVSQVDWKTLITNFYKEVEVNKKVQSEWAQTIKNKDAFIRFFRLKSVAEQKEFLGQLTREEKVPKRLADILKLFTANPDYFLSVPLVDFYHKLFQLLPNYHWSLKLVLQEIILKQMIPEKIELQNLTVPKLIRAEVATALGKDRLPKGNSHLKQVEAEDRADAMAAKKKPNLLDSNAIDGAYIGQAGLVLLAHFLPQFLNKTNYINETGQLINAKEVPILLHYMATGEITAPEWKLTLPKILAGLHVGEHCNTAIQPNKKLDIEINELLKAVIGHWEALKNTSPEGLRTTFLEREGELKSKNGFYYLYVNGQTVDILLNYVSWNYTTIKLNWMPHILFVEWNKT